MQFYEILAPIKDDMEGMEAELRRILESDVQLVKSVSDYLLESRGKRIRPALLILSSQACGHKGDDVIKTAAVVELAHTATLVHDDLIDHSDLRRGRPTVHRRWNEEISVIMGDWIFTSVFAYLIDNISRGLNDILHVLIQAIVKMCRAEMVELQNRFYLDFPEPEYLGMIRAVATDLVTVELATQASKAAGANLWTPVAVFEWPAGEGAAARRARQSGVEVVRSLGGVAYATRLREAGLAESVRFENLTEKRLGELLDWIEEEAGDGLDEFTYVDYARVLWRVRVEMPSFEWRRNERDLAVAEIRLLLLAENSYI